MTGRLGLIVGPDTRMAMAYLGAISNIGSARPFAHPGASTPCERSTHSRIVRDTAANSLLRVMCVNRAGATSPQIAVRDDRLHRSNQYRKPCMSYTIAWEKRGICVAYTGIVGFQEFMDAILAIHNHPDYAMFRYAIHDMSQVSKLDFSEVNMTQLQAQELGARYTNPGIKASVVTDNAAMCDMVRQFSSLTNLYVGLLQNLEQAREWSA